MPTYLYECRECHRQLEFDQRISDPPLEDCECGAKGSLRKLIQPTAVMFKGAGFHVNDYAGKAPAPQEKPAAAPEPCGDGCACNPHE